MATSVRFRPRADITRNNELSQGEDVKADSPVRRGISKDWPSRKRVIDWINKMTPWTMDQAIAYNDGVHLGPGKEKLLPRSSYNPVGYRANLCAQSLALEGKPWEQAMSKALGYQLFGHQLDFFWHRQFRLIFPEHPRPLRLMNWTAMTEVMAISFVIGWIDKGAYQGYLTHLALNRGYQLETSYVGHHRRTHAFMLRLFSAFSGDVSHEWPSFARDEPIYEFILEQWDVDDPELLVPWLLSACDRHTHEARPDTEKLQRDCSNFPQTPLEILLLFRLRSLVGLKNPQLDHPLMASPFDRPVVSQPDYIPDELMMGTLNRVRVDWPEFERWVSLEEVRKICTLN
jgi:hypothetical protein